MEMLSKALSGMDKQKVIRKELYELKKSEDYKIGKKYHELEKKLRKASPAKATASYKKFANSYPNHFYGKLASQASAL